MTFPRPSDYICVTICLIGNINLWRSIAGLFLVLQVDKIISFFVDGSYICRPRMLSFFVTRYVFLILILNLVKLLRTFWNLLPKIEMLEWNPTFSLFQNFGVKFHAVSRVFNILEWNAMRFLVFSIFWSEMPCGFFCFQLF